MRTSLLFSGVSLLSLCSLLGCSTTEPVDVGYGPGAPAQLFGGLGSHTRPVTTSSPEAQAYFDEGLNWLFAFNHDEAVRSFTKAAALDPGCAMAWWGVSYAQGPNYNDPVMTEGRSRAAWEALEKARAAVDSESPAERALIGALGARYANPWPEDRSGLNAAFAEAMGKVWARFDTDTDVAALYADSIMVQTPWMLYDVRTKEPIEAVPTVLATLERGLELDPSHPGLNHLYIHAVEPSKDPGKAAGAADRLCDAVPTAGHLQHMPSHIYVQVGRWADAVDRNAKALAADAAYRARSPEQFTQHLYMAHNAHMLAFAAMMTGREREAVDATRVMWEDIPEDQLEQVAPIVDSWMCARYDVEKRFGRWDKILAEAAPPAFMPVTTANWHAARAVALSAKKDFEGARRELEAFRRAVQRIPEDAMWGPDKTRTVLSVADHFIEGEIKLQQQDWAGAAADLEKAVEVEDTLAYGEPPNWLQPTRHTLGAVYLSDGRYADAERVYREDLTKWPGNGWSLWGLAESLRQQGREGEAAEAYAQYEQAWQFAEEAATTSCKCIERP